MNRKRIFSLMSTNTFSLHHFLYVLCDATSIRLNVRNITGILPISVVTMYLHIAGKTGIRLININELFMPAITHMHTYLIIASSSCMCGVSATIIKPTVSTFMRRTTREFVSFPKSLRTLFHAVDAVGSMFFRCPCRRVFRC